MKKNVSNVLNNIGKCRNLLEQKDFKKIRAYIGLFEKVQTDVNRYINRYMFDMDAELDFTPNDLKELSDEIRIYLDEYYPVVFSYDNFLKILEETQNGIIDNNVLKQYNIKICDYLYVDTKLRETMKILAYTSVLFKLWQINYQKYADEANIMFQITKAIKDCLK